MKSKSFFLPTETFHKYGVIQWSSYSGDKLVVATITGYLNDYDVIWFSPYFYKRHLPSYNEAQQVLLNFAANLGYKLLDEKLRLLL